MRVLSDDARARMAEGGRKGYASMMRRLIDEHHPDLDRVAIAISTWRLHRPFGIKSRGVTLEYVRGWYAKLGKDLPKNGV